jgi:hypothetical protein
VLVAEVGAREPVAQAQVAAAIGHEQQRAKRRVPLGGVRDPHVAAGDRLHARVARGGVELDETEQVREVGQRERGHPVVGRRADRVLDPHRAVGDRELAVQAQVDESRGGHAGDVEAMLEF